MVWSLPRPTLAPGCHFVPRWRTMMLPETTASPPNFFTPRRFDSESRPLRDEPPAFCVPLDFSFNLFYLLSRLGLGCSLLRRCLLWLCDFAFSGVCLRSLLLSGLLRWLCAVGKDLRDTDRRLFLTMTAGALRILTATLLNAITLRARPCSTTSAVTRAPATVGAPIVVPTSRTSANSTMSPASPATFRS